MTLPPIQISVPVALPPDRAFAAFTERIGDWWPLDRFSISGMRDGARSRSLHLDPRDGGQIFEVDTNGAPHLWGTLTLWDPPRRLGLNWHVGRGPDSATHVAVAFDPTDDGRTVVTLTQSNWEVLGEAAAEMQARNIPGWQTILTDGFATFAATLDHPTKGHFHA